MTDNDLQRAHERLTEELHKDMRVLSMETELRIEITDNTLPPEVMVHDCACGKGQPVLDSGLQIHHYIFCNGCGKRTAIKDTVVQAAEQWNLMAKL